MSENQNRESLEFLKLNNEVELQEIDKKIRLKELNKKLIFQPATITIIVALLGILGASISNYFQRKTQMEIEERKFQYSVYQKALEAKDNIIAAKILDFYIKAGLLPGEEGKYSKLLEEGKVNEVPIYSGIYKDIKVPTLSSKNQLKIENGFIVGKNTKYQISYNAKNRIDNNELNTIVLHCAFSPNINATARFLSDTINGRASAHLLIDRDGSVIQQVPFNFQSFHAGREFNNKSIGIEFINLGQLTLANGLYKTLYGKVIDRNNVDYSKSGVYWEKYTSQQIEKALEICKLLFEEYNIKYIVGHNEIDKNKIDPGPFFPIDKFKSLLNK